MAYLNLLETVDVAIANGASLSGAANLDGKALVAVITPAAWTGAAITFKKSPDGVTYYPVYDKNAEVSVAAAVIAAAERRWIDLDPTLMVGASYLKLNSGLNGADVAQGAARTLTLVVRPI